MLVGASQCEYILSAPNQYCHIWFGADVLTSIKIYPCHSSRNILALSRHEIRRIEEQMRSYTSLLFLMSIDRKTSQKRPRPPIQNADQSGEQRSALGIKGLKLDKLWNGL